MSDPPEPLLRVEDLKVSFRTENGVAAAVRGVSWHVCPGEVLAVVGESGSGKTVSAMATLGLIGDRNVEVEGHAWFDGRDLLQMSRRELRDVRGGEVGVIFQDPMTALHPVYTVGYQIVEQIRAHTAASRSAARRQAIDLLAAVGIPDPVERIDDYPHQFSGGMQQRVMIAMALSCDPRLVIADEPTTALDVTIQAQILALLRRIQQERDVAVVFITHDLGVVASIADRVAVMYAGQVVERGPKRAILEHPEHPYTQGLLASVPRLTGPRETQLKTIPGQPPALAETLTGCALAARCQFVRDGCRAEVPTLVDVGDGQHQAACLVPRHERVAKEAAPDA